MIKTLLIILLIMVLALAALLCAYFFAGWAPVADHITWGVNFSQMQTEALGLDWKKTYLAILEDLGAKNVKLMTQWDFIEGKRNNYFFKDIDWQIKQAELSGAKIIFVVGMKSGRWPECHQPTWVNGLPKSAQQDEILEYIGKVINRYKKSPAIFAWQAENEPFFDFGQCPWYDPAFVKKEVDYIKSLDPAHPVIVSDSGEQSMWFAPAKVADIVGNTMYRRIWVHVTDKVGFYAKFPLPPVFYYRKAQLIEWLFHKKVMCVELQAEPWGSRPFISLPLWEQQKTMDPAKFTEIVNYAKRSGLDTFYFWGTEWWYWLKEKQGRPEIWNEAKELLK